MFLCFFIFQEMNFSGSDIKKFLIFFSKGSFSYILGNRNPKKNHYILGNGNPKKLILQEVTF